MMTTGKAGAILAAYGFSPLKDIGGPNQSVRALLGVFAACMFLGLLSTFWIPESKGVSLEELGGEQELEETLRQRGEP
jgi:PHS family inorganic phosphate transporter-like MFS transporter